MAVTAPPRPVATFRGFKIAQRGRILRDRRVNLSRLTCRAVLSRAADAPLCAQPAKWLMTAACPHEHVVPSLGCDAHTDETRTQVITCMECRQSREPHRCMVTIEYVPLNRPT